MLAFLYEDEAQCLEESRMGNLRKTEGCMVRAMCGVQPQDITRAGDLMLMFGLNETIDQLAMASKEGLYGHLLRRGDSHVLRRAFDFEGEGQKMELRLKRTWIKRVEEKA